MSFNHQILTSFPNLNNKHIDYVIVFEVLPATPENSECILKRKEFFDELCKESFEIFNLKITENDKRFIYSLLHCKTERLLEEAEVLHLKMKLKKVKLNESCISRKICKIKSGKSRNYFINPSH